MVTGTYCQQREVEAITEDVEDNEGLLKIIRDPKTSLQWYSSTNHTIIRRQT